MSLLWRRKRLDDGSFGEMEKVFEGDVPDETDIQECIEKLSILEQSSAAHQAENTQQLNIIQREILRTKMRQTGLNLDPNAWSDTLEDISGIDTGLSSEYVFDNINKSLRLNAININYDANVLPQDSMSTWGVLGTASVESVSNGVLNVTTTFGNQREYTRNEPAITINKTKCIKSKFKRNSGTSTQGFSLKIFDGIKAAIVSFNNENDITYYSGSSFPSIAKSQDFTVYAEWSVELDNVNGLKVLKNGLQVGATVPYSSLPPDTYLGYKFQVNGNTNLSIDYVYYSSDKSIASATIVWKPQTSEGTFSKAVVESLVNLGTGSLTYEISRDNGTTFTPCAIDTVTDISSQPSGTSIVLKAIITGNAELLAVAWGGSV